MSYNKVILIGNVGKDPEVKYFDRDSCIATFTLATNERGYTKQNGEEVATLTDWHNIKTFKHTAMFVEKYVRKGAHLFVEGRLHYRDFADKLGHSQRVTEIVADRVELLGRGQGLKTPETETPPASTRTSDDSDKFKKYTDIIKGKDPDLPF
ncbi:single-stranded DNA-binding protein [Porphyromonas sp.]|uniref:single-stranded DNA-binding protein n=1 Tax=Porphyromonas sp. TaxID=1924944 RepID=UPI0026DC6A44|nr:single-stranded DNA-binding protein [Porphyromonas sp.]MDO4771206.1 single-stranded DNA-binding protein [Porphyromonas sp.]